MKEAIRQRARELGFDDCRFTSAAAPQSAEYFQRWLAEGKHGEMGYLERGAPKRADIQLVLPDARSVISLAASYSGAGQSTNESGPDKGFIARYARYTDYHDVLGQRLKELTRVINQLGEGTR